MNATKEMQPNKCKQVNATEWMQPSEFKKSEYNQVNATKVIQSSKCFELNSPNWMHPGEWTKVNALKWRLQKESTNCTKEMHQIEYRVNAP